ncbi:hypothetical protein ACFYKT_07245 [Cytobacillus sp. FJAT-53684]|uniref:Transposase n=1 Tax=Cytobacillus mangrovibacter TaxID=3299024 RepID=A0ABW6JW83_9BACI
MNEQEVREALIEWENLSANKENKVLYEARLKYLRDQLSNIRGERRLGREEGMASIIQRMIERGLHVSDIVNITGLKEEEVQEILSDK